MQNSRCMYLLREGYIASYTDTDNRFPQKDKECLFFDISAYILIDTLFSSSFCTADIVHVAKEDVLPAGDNQSFGKGYGF